jgi:hypothetical protein
MKIYGLFIFVFPELNLKLCKPNDAPLPGDVHFSAAETPPSSVPFTKFGFIS